MPRLRTIGHTLRRIRNGLRILGGLVRRSNLRRVIGSRLVSRLGNLPDGIQIIRIDIRVYRAA